MKWLKLIGVVVLIVAAIFGIKAYKVKKTFEGYAAMGEPKATVTARKVAMEDWNPTLSAIGSLRAVQGVSVSAEVSGQVQAVRFSSGTSVRKGTVLLQLVADTDAARLTSLRTSRDLAQSTFNRAKEQFAADLISKATLEDTEAALKTTTAAMQEQAALLAKKTIRAPFDGKVGITTVNVGQFLNPGDKIVTVQQLDPIYVDFNVPQNALTQISIGQKVSASTDAGLASNGEITAIEPIVDTETRNVRVQATLRNQDGKLLPGMYTKLQVTSGAAQKYLTLPATAIAFNPYGETVYLVVAAEKYYAEESAKKKAAGEVDANTAPPPEPKTKDGKPKYVAKQVFVTTGPTRGDQVAVLSGIKEGDEVVTSGQLKLKNGLVVLVDNTVVPSNDPAPKIKDE